MSKSINLKIHFIGGKVLELYFPEEELHQAEVIMKNAFENNFSHCIKIGSENWANTVINMNNVCYMEIEGIGS